MRSGAQTLTLLASPRIFPILGSLATGPKGRIELRRDSGLPAQSTLRSLLNTLESIGALTRRRKDVFPGTNEYELTDTGSGLLVVAGGLRAWLAESTAGALRLGEDTARAATKGLVDAWTTTVLPALATQPLSLTELDKRISAASYPTIERCLETLRLAGQVEAGERSRGGAPYALTDWLRRGLAPLALAARWEHSVRPAGAAPIERLDVEHAFAVIAPLLQLPTRSSGTCQLAAREAAQRTQDRFLCYIDVADGRAALGSVYPQEKPDAWASALVDGWFAALIESDLRGFRFSGNRAFALELIQCVHQSLFKQPIAPSRNRAFPNKAD